MHEDGLAVGEVGGSDGIPGCVLRDKPVVDEVREVGLPGLKLSKLLWLDEHDIGGASGVVGPDVHEEVSFDGLVDWVRMRGMAETGNVNAAGVQEGMKLLGNGPRVSLEGSSERGGERFDDGSGDGITVSGRRERLYSAK